MGVFINPRIIIISAEDETELQKLVAGGVADDYFSKGKPITELQDKIAAQLKLAGRSS
jgi:DNA-binding response OmpR family regulator